MTRSQQKGHPGAWPDGLSDELPGFPGSVHSLLNYNAIGRQQFQETIDRKSKPTLRAAEAELHPPA
jgi:hypothetical protein